MIFSDLNFIAIVVAAVLNMVLGMLWYSPQLFGSIWMNSMKSTTSTKTDSCKTDYKSEACKTDANGNKVDSCKTDDKECCECKPTACHIISGFLVALVTAWGLALFIDWVGGVSALAGATVGFFAWLAFVATTCYSAVIWCKKPLHLYFIDAGFYLVAYLIMGAVIGAWQ